MMEPSGPKVTMRQHHRAELERLASGNRQTRAASRLSAIGSMPDELSEEVLSDLTIAE